MKFKGEKLIYNEFLDYTINCNTFYKAFKIPKYQVSLYHVRAQFFTKVHFI